MTKTVKAYGRRSKYSKRKSARRLARFIKKVAKTIPETKWITNPISTGPTVYDSGGTVVVYTLISGCSQGTNWNQRVGDQIMGTGLSLDFEIQTFVDPNVIAGSTGASLNFSTVIWVVTNPKRCSVDDTQNYINSWYANVGTSGYPDPELVKTIKKKFYFWGYDAIETGTGNAWNQFQTYGTRNMRFKYAKPLKKKILQFENGGTASENKQYWLLIVTQGLTAANATYTAAGWSKYTYKDS